MSDVAPQQPAEFWSRVRSVATAAHKRVPSGVGLAALLLIGSGTTLYELNSYGVFLRPGMRFLQDNLPLTLPILSVLMGVMLRPFELRSISGSLLNSQLGRSSDPITQSQVYRGITAKTDEEAIKKALTEFNKSDASIQFSGGRSPDSGRRVEVMESYLVASPERLLSLNTPQP